MSHKMNLNPALVKRQNATKNITHVITLGDNAQDSAPATSVQTETKSTTSQ